MKTRKFLAAVTVTAMLLATGCGATTDAEQATQPQTEEASSTEQATQPQTEEATDPEQTTQTQIEETTATEPATQTQAEAATSIEPLPLIYTDTVSDGVPDGYYHVSFDGSIDLKEVVGAYTLTMDFYEYDRYATEDIESLTPGSTITFKGESIEVETVSVTENEAGEPILIVINGGYEEGGLDLGYDAEEDCVRAMTLDGGYDLYTIGLGTIPVSEYIFIDDYTGLDSPDAELPEEEVAGYDDVPTALGERVANANNTYATIRDGELVAVTVKWVP